jgi:hypothetical protein
MASFQEITQKKIAGVPVLYLAAAFVAILAIVAWKMKPSVPPEEPTGDESTTPGNVPTAEGDVDYSGLATNGTVTVVQGSQTPTEAKEQTNDDWERAAVDYLVDSKLATPGDAQIAINTYLEGGNLSFEQGKLRDAAVAKLKLPPEPLHTVGTTGTEPARRQAGTLPGSHIVKGSNDNTAAKLAALYYGNSDALHTNKIASANLSLGPSGTTYNPGTKVSIPMYTNPRYYTIDKSHTWPSQVAAKNGLSYNQFLALNPGLVAPYKVGSKVRVF